LIADTLWYKDTVFYELHVKPFQDSSGDGADDFGGLIQRPDNVRNLKCRRHFAVAVLPLPCATTALQQGNAGAVGRPLQRWPCGTVTSVGTVPWLIRQRITKRLNQ
jgi:hypothetical protein